MNLTTKCWRADPSVIVSKRLPTAIRRQRLLPSSSKKDLNETSVPLILKSFIRLSLSEKKNLSAWNTLCENIMHATPSPWTELLPAHLSKILECCARIGYRNEKFTNFIQERLKQNCDIRSGVIALLSLQKLQAPLRSLENWFLCNIRENCYGLSFSDLRRVLICFARLKIKHRILVEEICNALYNTICSEEHIGGKTANNKIKSKNLEENDNIEELHVYDSRQFFIFPFCFSRLKYIHDQIFKIACARIDSVIYSRIRCLPLDALQALDGFLTIGEPYSEFSKRVKNYSEYILSECSTKELTQLYGAFKSLEISNETIWNIWAEEISQRLEELSSEQLESVLNIFQLLDRPVALVMHYANKKKRAKDAE